MAKNKLTKDQKRKKKLARAKKKSNLLVFPACDLPDLDLYAEEQVMRAVVRSFVNGTLEYNPERMPSLKNIVNSSDLKGLLRMTGGRLDIFERAQTYAFAAMEASFDGDAERVVSLCEQALALDPENIDALRMKLTSGKQVGSEELESLVNQARSKGFLDSSGTLPGNFGFVFWSPYLRTVHEYGRCLLEEKRFEKAVAIFREALDVDPDDSEGLRILEVLALLRVEDFSTFDEELILLQTAAKAREDAAFVCEADLLDVMGMLKRGEDKAAEERFFDLLDTYSGVGKNILLVFSKSMEGMDVPPSLETEISPEDIFTTQSLLSDVAFLDEHCQGWFITKTTIWFLERNEKKIGPDFFCKDMALMSSEIMGIIGGLTDKFCLTFPDGAPASVCRNIIAALGESPLDFVQSLPESWAAGVIHFMGKQNGMFKARHPCHFKAGSLVSHFGISAATYLNKSKMIDAELSRMGKNNAALWGLEGGEDSGRLSQREPLISVSSKKSAKARSALLAEDRILEVKIHLQHTRPPVWRLVKVPEHLTLGEFHEVIQESMGWSNCHLHEFNVHGKTYSDPRAPLDNVLDENTVLLGDMLRVPGDRMVYTYDFGDAWDHLITLKKEHPSDSSGPVLCCIKGKRACPLEDSGGPWGYEHLAEILNDPEHEEYEDMAEWVESDFDPEAFDVKEVNRALAGLLKGFEKRQ